MIGTTLTTRYFLFVFRWEVELKSIRHLGVGRPERHLFMYNYLSIGVDAQVTLNFHLARKSELYVKKSRFINKVLSRSKVVLVITPLVRGILLATTVRFF